MWHPSPVAGPSNKKAVSMVQALGHRASLRADRGARVRSCSPQSVGGLCKLAVEKRLVNKGDVILWAAGAVRHMGTQQQSVVIAVLVALENKIRKVGGQGMPGSKISE